MNTTTPAPQAMNKETQLREHVATLQTLLLQAHPQMPTLLQQIHHNLKKDEDLVQFLNEEEIGVIVAGLKQHANIVIATNIINKNTNKSMRNITLDDL